MSSNPSPAPESRSVIVLHDYTYEKSDGTPICILKDEVFALVDQTNDSWWRVKPPLTTAAATTAGGEVGRPRPSKGFYVPAKYVKVVDDENAATHKNMEKSLNNTSSQKCDDPDHNFGNSIPPEVDSPPKPALDNIAKIEDKNPPDVGVIIESHGEEKLKVSKETTQLPASEPAALAPSTPESPAPVAAPTPVAVPALVAAPAPVSVTAPAPVDEAAELSFAAKKEIVWFFGKAQRFGLQK